MFRQWFRSERNVVSKLSGSYELNPIVAPTTTSRRWAQTAHDLGGGAPQLGE
jgi:hypothetical protein